MTIKNPKCLFCKCDLIADTKVENWWDCDCCNYFLLREPYQSSIHCAFVSSEEDDSKTYYLHICKYAGCPYFPIIWMADRINEDNCGEIYEFPEMDRISAKAMSKLCSQAKRIVKLKLFL
jgi:hypothetical protein